MSGKFCSIILPTEFRDNSPLFIRKPIQRCLPREALLCRAMLRRVGRCLTSSRLIELRKLHRLQLRKATNYCN
jgi:hypothetical protein